MICKSVLFYGSWTSVLESKVTNFLLFIGMISDVSVLHQETCDKSQQTP